MRLVLSGLEKTLNSSFPSGQVGLKVCLSKASLSFAILVIYM